nr:MAG TPA: hypothetical protein [Caudoviricetes sp.]
MTEHPKTSKIFWNRRATHTDMHKTLNYSISKPRMR